MDFSAFLFVLRAYCDAQGVFFIAEQNIKGFCFYTAIGQILNARIFRKTTAKSFK